LFAKQSNEQSDYTATKISTASKNSAKDNFLNKHPMRNIAELLDVAQGVPSVILGIVIAIQEDEGWCYTGCRTCCTKVIKSTGYIDLESEVPRKPTNGPNDWWCRKCQACVSLIKTQFRLQIRVQDEVGTMSLSLFNDKSEFDGLFPSEITSLIGTKYAFKVAIDDYNAKKLLPVFNVLRLSNDPDIINSIIPCATLVKDNEATSKTASDITPLDLESQTEENTTPTNAHKSTATSPDEKEKTNKCKAEGEPSEFDGLFPSEITSLIGTKYAFKVVIDDYNARKLLHVFNVLRLYNDPDIINSIIPCATPDNEASSKIASDITPLMVGVVQNTNNTTIRSILLAEKLTGSNFTNWYHNLRIVLMYEKKIKFMEQPIGLAPDPETVDPNTIDKYYESVNLEQEVSFLMLSSMSSDLQRTLEKYNAFDMIQELKTMFEEQAKQELFEKVKAFHACKTGGWSVSKLLSIEDEELPRHFGTPRLCNAKRTCMGKTIAELHAMLKLHEKGAKRKAKGKNKLAYAPKTKIPLPPKRDNLAKDSIFHHYKEVGHWRRNFLSYHAELKKRKNASVASTSIVNGMRAAVEAIRSFDLILPSGLIIVLDNCHFAPTVTRGVVLISRLVKNGYIHTFTNYGISVSKDNVFYFNAIPRDGIYEIDMHNLYPNISSNYNVSNKRAKHRLDSYYLWHCHLGHINKKRMDMLQRDGLLQPTHDESHEKCKSCISRKMARKPFPHQVERAKDLLGLIHTDVCGPFRTMSREGANYFITFTDDFSRYGFVYLMKHKHEVFETFKVFQNEVENQLGKKIKAIRSDRGGEYLSHEFVNHMKSYGIVSQLTPPYTPQHNGVSERRNRTLLDMVRSMMNLTTLPKSFWGYALETAARILNMVPTKKVDRMPYEIWHGKAPNLSYLRV
ncbi:retrotransposon protein, putative, ty1-copia subclass, partial [Tanacetum coccineum]